MLQVLGMLPQPPVTSGVDICWHLSAHERCESAKAAVDYPYLDTLAGEPRLIPGCRAVNPGAVAGNPGPALRFFGGLNRPYADDSGLFRGFRQQQDGHIGFDVVVSGRYVGGAVGFQKANYAVHVS